LEADNFERCCDRENNQAGTTQGISGQHIDLDTQRRFRHTSPVGPLFLSGHLFIQDFAERNVLGVYEFEGGQVHDIH
jgi:hypothetical protein